MSYKIVVDSCCELPEEYRNDSRFETIPLGLQVGDWHIMDDENFNQAEFLHRVATTPDCPKSSCPSPEKFMESYNSWKAHARNGNCVKLCNSMDEYVAEMLGGIKE